MVKLWNDNDYDFETGLLSSLRGGGLSLIVLEDGKGGVHTIVAPSIRDVESMCEKYKLDVRTLMNRIAGLKDETVSLVIKLPEYRSHDVEKRHKPSVDEPTAWIAERWVEGRVALTRAGDSAREALEYVRDGVLKGTYHVQRLISPEGELYVRGHKSWANICSQEEIYT